MDAGQVLAELAVLGAQLRDFLVGQFKTAARRFLAGAAAGLPGGRLDARLRRSCSIFPGVILVRVIMQILRD